MACSKLDALVAGTAGVKRYFEFQTTASSVPVDHCATWPGASGLPFSSAVWCTLPNGAFGAYHHSVAFYQKRM
jgi:hypothetical protein